MSSANESTRCDHCEEEFAPEELVVRNSLRCQCTKLSCGATATPNCLARIGPKPQPIGGFFDFWQLILWAGLNSIPGTAATNGIARTAIARV